MVGRLTRDPELRRTVTGKSVCSFDIAISRRMKDPATGEWKDADPTFVPIVVWGDQADRCAERLKKGVPVHVEGRLQTNKWEGSDGVKKSRLEVVASRVQFLSVIKQTSAAAIGAKPDEDGQPAGASAESPAPSYSDGADDEDIPF
jgi:single-strand DNA-binding protein